MTFFVFTDLFFFARSAGAPIRGCLIFILGGGLLLHFFLCSSNIYTSLSHSSEIMYLLYNTSPACPVCFDGHVCFDVSI